MYGTGFHEGGRDGKLAVAAGRADPTNQTDPTGPLDALDEFIAAFVGFWASDRVVIRRLRSLAGLDPEVEAAVSARDAKRRAGLRVLVIRLIEAPGRLKADATSRRSA